MVTKATCATSSRLVRNGGGGVSSDGVNNVRYVLEQTSFSKKARPSPGMEQIAGRTSAWLFTNTAGPCWVAAMGPGSQKEAHLWVPLGPLQMWACRLRRVCGGLTLRRPGPGLGGQGTGCCVHFVDLMPLETAYGSRAPTLSSFQLRCWYLSPDSPAPPPPPSPWPVALWGGWKLRRAEVHTSKAGGRGEWGLWF